MGAVARAMPYLIEPLANHHNRAVFSCGKEDLDRYLKNQAGQDARRKVAVTFVLVEVGGKDVLGYYTLSAFGIDLGDLPPHIVKKLPRYPVVPATLIGRLALDSRLRGQRLGEFLLMDALQRAFMQSYYIASAAVVVDAIDEEARRFYLHFDFLSFPSRPERLFLPMRTVSRLFR
jgi:GNAT superfamily N-acetyltransferase